MFNYVALNTAASQARIRTLRMMVPGCGFVNHAASVCESEGGGRLFQQSDYSLSVLFCSSNRSTKTGRAGKSGILARNPLGRPCSEISRGQIDAARQNARFDSAHKDQ